MKDQDQHTSRLHQNARDQSQRQGEMGSIATFTSFAELFSRIQQRVHSLLALSQRSEVPEPVRAKTAKWLEDLDATLRHSESLDDNGEVGKLWLQSGPGPQIQRLDEALEALDNAGAEDSTFWALRAHIALADTLESIARSIPRSDNSEWLDRLAEQSRAIATEVTRIENELEVE